MAALGCVSGKKGVRREAVGATEGMSPAVLWRSCCGSTTLAEHPGGGGGGVFGWVPPDSGAEQSPPSTPQVSGSQVLSFYCSDA